MFGSAVFDVAIGLVFIFLLLSLICSAANELIEIALKKRAKDLEKGIGELIGDPQNASGFLSAIYDHGLVNGLFRGDYKTTPKWKLPAYIPAANFALAVMDIYQQRKTDGPAPVIPGNVKTAFETFDKLAASGGKKMQDSVEQWFNSGMERVSGWYKRRTQIFILVMGLAVAVFVNADCIEIAQRLSTDTSLRQGVVALAEARAKDQPADAKTKSAELIKDDIHSIEGLGLPFGWPPPNAKEPQQAGLFEMVFKHGLGWLLTALAVSLGAPFWFDMLNKIIVVRSTLKPGEKTK